MNTRAGRAVRRATYSARSAWEWLTDPPHMRKSYMVVYAITTLIGVVTFVSPPFLLHAQIGPVLVVVWAWCFIVGGAIGLATVWTDWWWLERLGLIIAGLGGLGVYGYVAVLHHLESVTGSRLTQLGVITLAATVYAVRWLTIKDYSYAPRVGRWREG